MTEFFFGLPADASVSEYVSGPAGPARRPVSCPPYCSSDGHLINFVILTSLGSTYVLFNTTLTMVGHCVSHPHLMAARAIPVF